jgi:hypothetical protein
MQGPHVSGRGVRRQFVWKMQFQRENVFSEMRQEHARGLDGLMKEVTAYWGGGPVR